jgi:threonine/homoserine/homoserine lactone efflux protein
MIWDIVVANVQVVFVVAMLPSLVSDKKPHVWSSAITAAGLGVMTVAFFNMEIYFTAATTFLGALVWWILYLQEIARLTNGRRPKK